jgi:hypothetical protein
MASKDPDLKEKMTVPEYWYPGISGHKVGDKSLGSISTLKDIMTNIIA